MWRYWRRRVISDILLCSLLLTHKIGQLLLQHPSVCFMPCIQPTKFQNTPPQHKHMPIFRGMHLHLHLPQQGIGVSHDMRGNNTTDMRSIVWCSAVLVSGPVPTCKLGSCKDAVLSMLWYHPTLCKPCIFSIPSKVSSSASWPASDSCFGEGARAVMCCPRARSSSGLPCRMRPFLSCKPSMCRAKVSTLTHVAHYASHISTSRAYTEEPV